MAYIENESEFRLYITDIKSKSNYISWLNFLSNYGFNINSSVLSNEVIIDKLKSTVEDRSQYKKNTDYSNFGSALNKYRSFLNTNNIPLIKDLISIDNDPLTEREELRKARLGQGKFRTELIKLWKSCAVTKFNKPEFLIASHILPWRESDNTERLNPYNGLLLQPNYDKLFDKGYISFTDNGNIILSKKLTIEEYSHLGIRKTDKLLKVFDESIPFIKKHRELYNDILNDVL